MPVFSYVQIIAICRGMNLSYLDIEFPPTDSALSVDKSKLPVEGYRWVRVGDIVRDMFSQAAPVMFRDDDSLDYRQGTLGDCGLWVCAREPRSTDAV